VQALQGRSSYTTSLHRWRPRARSSHLWGHYRKLRLPLESQVCRGLFLSGPRQRKSLPSTALGTAVLTALHPLPRVGPSAGRDPQHNQLFAESQPSTWSGVRRRRRSERRHIWAAVHYADGSAVRPSAQVQPVPSAVPSASSKALGKGVNLGLTRLTVLCREPAGALPRAPPGSRQRSNFFSFWVGIISLLKVH
jgi:hypothetical protein